MAAAAVLALPELHEAILWQTDMVTLLVSAQRVSKAWRHLITTSPALQQKLFLQPAPGDAHPSAAMPFIDRQGADDSVDGATDDLGKLSEALPSLTRNPLLVKYFSPCFFETHKQAYFRAANSFMALPWTPSPRKEKLDDDGLMRSIPVDPPEDAYVQPFRQRFFRSGASWRRMLVQPPVRQLGCLWSTETQEGDFFAREYVAVITATTITPKEDDSASHVLRMGRLYDLVQEHVCRHDLHNLWFRVHWDAVREPVYCQASQALGRRVIARSRVVVEFVTQEYPCINPEEPPSAEVFDDVFRCDEHEPLKVDFASGDAARRVVWPERHMSGMLSRFAAVYDAAYILT